MNSLFIATKIFLKLVQASFEDDKRQIKDPNQLALKFIPDDDIEIKKYNAKTLPKDIFNQLIEKFHNGGTICGQYEIIDNFKESGGGIPKLLIFCAFVKDELVGVFIADPYTEYTALNKTKKLTPIGPKAEVEVFILSQYRQSGIATKLYQEAQKYYPNLGKAYSPLGSLFTPKMKGENNEKLNSVYNKMMDRWDRNRDDNDENNDENNDNQLNLI